jgi:hypothetical protein
MVDCVKITCQKNGESAERYVYYIRTDLGNANTQLENVINFVKKTQFVTFLKSASYALHDSSLSKFKKFILKNTRAVLQDDTGIPFADFNDSWKKYAFGTYQGPAIEIFKGYKQQSMVEFFQQSDPISIPFKMGYGFRYGKPNLLLAVQE